MKNKIILILLCLFSAFFIFFIFKLSDDIQRKEEILAASPNVMDVTNDIRTKALVTAKDLPSSEWANTQINESSWKDVKIPDYQPIKESEFKEGSFGYYRIHIPKSVTEKFNAFDGELEFSPQYVFFSKAEIFVNGKFVKNNSAASGSGALVTIPVESGKDNIISIKGKIKNGDSGIKHRGKLFLGKSSDIREIYSSSYKGTIVFPLIFLLCKGSVIFVFALIYLLMNVQKFFEKSLVFSICSFGEDFLTGDFLAKLININVRVYCYNLLNVVGAVFLFLFLADVAGMKIKKKTITVAGLILGFLTYAAALDILHTSHLFNFNTYLQMWNLIFICVIAFYIPMLAKKDKVLVTVMVAAIGLSGLSLFYSNVGLNYKMMGNLLLFFMVAYQSFALFRREQLKLQEQEIQLIEQEKDVAIGKTASLLAHDVRRPLEQMKLILDKVSSGQVSDEFIRAARSDVNFSITSVNNQINDIMNYSKSRPADLIEISFYSVLSGSLKQIMTINRNLELKLVCDFKAQVKVLGDESRLAGALTNLLSNAVEAIRDIGKKSSGEIRMTTELINNKFVFRIHNDGPAIPENVFKDIWKPMFTMGKEKGTGLGLSSVMKTILDHNGEIRVRNTGDGVEFEIQLKAASATDKVSDYEFHSTSRDYNYDVKQVENSKLRPLRIFLLDDDIQVQEYFQSLIKNLPFHVDLTFVTHYESARQAVNAKRYDLYILDHDLGGGVSGEDFRKDNLAYLGDEVLIHSRKPMPFEELLNACESVYTKRMKILLVDDGELTLMAWEMFHGKHNIRTASSPEMAITILEDSQNQFDLAVVDYYFDNSSMTGEALAHKLKTMNPELSIVLSSNSELKVSGFKSIEKNQIDVRTLGLSAKT